MLKAMIQQLSNDWDSMWKILSVLLVLVTCFFVLFCFFIIKLVQFLKKTCPLDEESGSSRGWLSLWICYHENLCGWLCGGQWVWIYQGQVFQTMLTRWKSQCGFQQLGESGRRKGCGGWEANIRWWPLCIRHLTGVFEQVVFFIFSVQGQVGFIPIWGHLAQWSSTLSPHGTQTNC